MKNGLLWGKINLNEGLDLSFNEADIQREDCSSAEWGIVPPQKRGYPARVTEKSKFSDFLEREVEIYGKEELYIYR